MKSHLMIITMNDINRMPGYRMTDFPHIILEPYPNPETIRLLIYS